MQAWSTLSMAEVVLCSCRLLGHSCLLWEHFTYEYGAISCARSNILALLCAGKLPYHSFQRAPIEASNWQRYNMNTEQLG